MKKLLLLFTLLTAALGSASAEEKTFIMSEQGWTEGQDLSNTTINNGFVEISFAKNDASTPPKYMNNNGVLDVRLYKKAKGKTNGCSFSVKALTNVTLKSVTYKESAAATKTTTVTVSNNEATYINTTNSTAKVYSITVNYVLENIEAVDPTNVEFTPAAGTYTEAQSVTLKADGQKEDGSAWPIYYTTNGNEPTETPELLYNGEPISVESSMTIKAIAVGSKATDVCSAEYIINYPAAELPAVTCNGSTYENNATVNVPYLANLTVKSANATSIVKIYNGQDEIFENTGEYSFCPDRDGVYKFYGVGKGGDSDEFTLTINIVPVNTAASQAVTASYNFSEPATLLTTTGKTFSAETGEDQDNGNTCTTVDGITFENEGIHVTFDVVEGASNPTTTRIYYSSTAGITLRAYKNHTLKIEAPNGEILKSITLTFAKAITSGLSATSWSYSASEDNKTYTWTPNTDNASASEANFTISGSLQIKSIDVVYEAGTGEAVIAMPLLKVDNAVVEDPESLGEISGRSLTFTAAEGSVIEHQIEGETVASRAISDDAWVTTDSNVYTYNVPATLENDITLNIRAKAGDSYSEVRSINIAKDGTITGIEAVAADSAEGEAEYFNLQGIRVANPQGGVFIRRQGAKVAKVAL